MGLMVNRVVVIGNRIGTQPVWSPGQPVGIVPVVICQRSLSRGGQGAACVTCVQEVPSSDTQTSFKSRLLSEHPQCD